MISNNFKKLITSAASLNKISHCYLLKTYKGVNLDEHLVFMINNFTNSNIKSIENTPANIIVADASKSTGEGLKKNDILTIFESSSFSNITNSEQKIIIFKNIELASHVALNALLKTIEEPGNNVTFVLTTTNAQLLLPTIKSRSFIININKSSNDEIKHLLASKNLNPEISWLYSKTLNDVDELENINISSDLIFSLVKALEDSFKNKFALSYFLTCLNKKEMHTQLVFLFRILKFFYSAKYLYFQSKPKEFQSLFSKITKSNNDFRKSITAIDSFLNNIKENINLFLQIEALINKIMECYE